MTLRLPPSDVYLCKPGYPAWRKPKHNWSAKAKKTNYHQDGSKEAPETMQRRFGHEFREGTTRKLKRAVVAAANPP